jgi:hypothetical protein
MTMYRRLDAHKIVATARLLQSRIGERFPLSGLSKLGDEVSKVADETLDRLTWIQKPHIPLRLGVFLLVVVILFVLGLLFATLRVSDLHEMATFIQVLDAGLSCIFFIGASVIFLLTWESRIKRNRALASIHELRAMAHIVDMHQLTKDPGAGGTSWAQTASSPRRSLNPFELGRYLDYCSEMLSIIGKIAALYSQSLEDPVVLDAVDDVEDLTTELSQKIWQKIALLDKSGGV